MQIVNLSKKIQDLSIREDKLKQFTWDILEDMKENFKNYEEGMSTLPLDIILHASRFKLHSYLDVLNKKLYDFKVVKKVLKLIENEIPNRDKE